METLILIKPATIQVVPINGQLAVMVDPREILDNPDAADMVAEVIRGLAAARGEEVLIFGACIQDAIEHASLGAGEKFMFHLPVSKTVGIR